MTIPTLPPTSSLPRFITFEDCEKGQTAAKTGCTPQEGGGGKEEGKAELSGPNLIQNSLNKVRNRFPALGKFSKIDKMRIGTPEEMERERSRDSKTGLDEDEEILGFVYGGDLIINPKMLEKEFTDKFYNENKDLYVATSGKPEDVATAIVLHELGHQIDMSGHWGMNRGDRENALREVLDIAQEGGAPISIYAQENDKEAFAELFASMLLGYRGRDERGSKAIDSFESFLEESEIRSRGFSRLEKATKSVDPEGYDISTDAGKVQISNDIHQAIDKEFPGAISVKQVQKIENALSENKIVSYRGTRMRISSRIDADDFYTTVVAHKEPELFPGFVQPRKSVSY